MKLTFMKLWGALLEELQKQLLKGAPFKGVGYK